MSRWVESVDRVVAAPAGQIFDLLADPARHRDIDGSGTVRAARQAPRRLALGDTFGMEMEFGGAYAMTSTVVEFVADRRIAWQSRPAAGSSRWRFLFGGRIWRYDLHPEPDGTRVTESWDLTQERLRLLTVGYRRKTRANMVATLQRIAEITAAEAPPAGTARQT